MSFGAAVRSVYSNYAKFDGRASRSEYWWFQLFLLLVALAWVAIFVVFVFATRSFTLAGVVGLAIIAIYLASIIPSLAVLCRRLHDSDHSGWWFWITLVPYVGALILLVFTVLPSSAGYNRYGPPSGVPPADAFAQYHGWTRAQALQQFSEDAQRAAASGYQPVHQEWQQHGNTEVLMVAYQRRGPGWTNPPGHQAPPWQGPNGGLS